ncbi:MAG: hypothetical protein IK016_11205 [Lachnospiraceae bacterium]|nr:hypothetical protein [Lachnospiraceae bacterium]
MIACPNCAGQMFFDIPSQKLKCGHCETLIEPEQYEGDRHADESTEYEVTVFSCSQCGARIMSTDVSATGFCTYCGGAAVFESRVSEEKKPDYIIPFQKTKEDCIRAYRQRLRRAIYAPGKMRDPKFLERFTGVYVPYWVYETQMDAHPALQGTEEFREGDNLHFKTYTLTADVSGEYAVTYDASSFFHDETATAISPFEVKGMKEFTPAMLSGFFADTADVDSVTYLQEAKNLIGEDAYLKMVGRHFHSVSPSVPYGRVEMDKMFALDKVEAKRALFPVWFLTWRNKDRVSYAAMNAQTGKLAADIPIDAKRFLAGSVLLAVPFWFLYRSLFTATAPKTLLVTLLAGCLFLLLFLKAGWRYCEKESGESDTGILARKHTDEGGSEGSRPVSAEFRPPKLPRHMKNRGNTLQGLDRLGLGAAGRAVFGAAFGVIAGLIASILPGMMRTTGNHKGYTSASRTLNAVTIVSVGRFAGVLAGILVCVLLFRFLRKSVRARAGKAVLFSLPAFAGLLAASVILVMAPVADLPYFASVVAVLAGETLSFLGLIAVYNRLATRAVPNFHQREGGDQLAP